MDLFNNLMELCIDQRKEKFYFVDAKTQHMNVRTFGYHFASYEDWLRPDALEARGIMFEIDEAGRPVQILSRPMAKFFNYNENPLAMDFDLTQVDYFMTKEDGSLISSYMDNGIVKLKSKMSLTSVQAQSATNHLYKVPQADLLKLIEYFESLGYTVNMEWVSPDNRIVLDYEFNDLRILNIRHRDTGVYVDVHELLKNDTYRKYSTFLFTHPEYSDFIADTKAMLGIEGYVVKMKDGRFFKIKTDWYCALHHTKDSINSNKRLLQAIANNTSDDLRGMFHDDKKALEKIAIFEQHFFNFVRVCNDAIITNVKSLAGVSRKDYAIGMQKAFPNHMGFCFSIAMKLYGKPIDAIDTIIDSIVEYIIKKPEQFLPPGFSAEKDVQLVDLS
ncbi:MAG: T4 RnlA family RNA ligase [Culicoidibacterales bacterium]